MLQPLTLQPLTLDQVDAAVLLDQRCLGGLWTANGYQREVDSPNSDLLALVAPGTDSESSMVGLACLWAILEEAHITLLLMDLPYRGQGLGQMLLEVAADNPAAQRFYERHGFTLVGRRPAYYPRPQGACDALLFTRPLSGA